MRKRLLKNVGKKKTASCRVLSSKYGGALRCVSRMPQPYLKYFPPLFLRQKLAASLRRALLDAQGTGAVRRVDGERFGVYVLPRCGVLRLRVVGHLDASRCSPVDHELLAGHGYLPPAPRSRHQCALFACTGGGLGGAGETAV